MIFNKLVRDKIPEIIAKQGKKVTFRVLQDDEKEQALKDKLIEEVQELINAETREQVIEEMADIQEVLIALRSKYKIRLVEVQTVGVNKHAKRGGFENGYFLESVEDDQ